MIVLTSYVGLLSPHSPIKKGCRSVLNPINPIDFSEKP